MLFGHPLRIEAVQVTENTAENPRIHFEIDPRALFAALKAERAGGPKLVGYFHSHPGGDARPSVTDAAMAEGDGKIWVIAGASRVKGWRTTGDGFEPLSFSVFVTIDATTLPEAFPAELGAAAREAAQLAGRDLLSGHETHQFEILAGDCPVRIPGRIYWSRGVLTHAGTDVASQMANCLMTRSDDGYVRQAALRKIVLLNQPWSVPFVVALIGEYVIEILDDIEAALPGIDPAVMARFLKDNPGYFALTKARVASYWNAYYRHRHTRAGYVGFRLLAALEAMLASHREP